MANLYKDRFQIFSLTEIASLRKGGRILHDCLAHVSLLVRPGVTTKELDIAAETYIRDHGATPGFKGYRDFPAALCTSVNDACVHGLPNDRELREGDIIGLDSGVLFDGLYTDAAITVPVGNVSSDAASLIVATEEALKAGISAVRAGARTGDVSAAIHKVLKKRGFDAMRQLTGHGLGFTLHQFPDIPNFGKAGKGPIFPIGTIVAIEPISTAGSTRIREDADHWTLRTWNGALSAHAEHTVLITANGCEVLT